MKSIRASVCGRCRPRLVSERVIVEALRTLVARGIDIDALRLHEITVNELQKMVRETPLDARGIAVDALMRLVRRPA